MTDFDPHCPPHCPTCECCSTKTGGDDAKDAKRWRELISGWGGMGIRPNGSVHLHVTTPVFEVPPDAETFGEAFDRRYELDGARIDSEPTDEGR